MKYFIFILIVLLPSCSSLKRQKILGGVVGSVVLGSIAASLGKELSPNASSDKLNQTIGAATGGVVGFYLGTNVAESFWNKNPENKVSKTLLLENGGCDTPKGKIKVLRPKDLKRIKLETKLPPFLKGKVKEANIVTYEIESYEEETEDGRKIIHGPHKAYEYVLE